MNRYPNHDRRGLTLAELLVATTVMSLVVTALAVFTKAVMDGTEQAAQTSTATQTSRVITARIAHKVAIAQRVLTFSGTTTKKLLMTSESSGGWKSAVPGLDQVLILWERDGEPTDTAPGKANLIELVIYATHRNDAKQLLELRPKVDPSLVVADEDAKTMLFWLDRFRSGQDVEQPLTVLLNDLGGIRFEVEEYPEPQGIGGVVQQNVRMMICVSPENEVPTMFFSSATRRYVTAN